MLFLETAAVALIERSTATNDPFKILFSLKIASLEFALLNPIKLALSMLF
jgi:hypothetical protein